MALLTVSDRSFAGVYQDRSGPALRVLIEKKGWVVAAEAVVPDERAEIQSRLISWSDADTMNVILTTGGTGLGPRDVTPEATQAVLNRQVPGLAEVMRMEGLKHTPLSPLSRSVAGTRGHTLIVNFPGNPDGACQSFRAIEHLIPHAIHTGYGGDHEKSH